MNLTDTFLQGIFAIKDRPVSTGVERLIRAYLMDTVGVALAGAKDLADKERALLQLMGDQNGKIRPIGLQEYTSVSNAIFVNGLSSHFLEKPVVTRQADFITRGLGTWKFLMNSCVSAAMWRALAPSSIF